MAAETLRKIQLTHVTHAYYRHKDAAAARQFAEDFGFFEEKQVGKRTYYRGYGTEPFVVCIEEADETAWGGAAFAVATAEDLDYAVATLPVECRPTAVYDLTDAPGGGRAVTFYDPVDGFPFHLVHGQQRVEARDPMFPVSKVNYVCEGGPSVLYSRISAFSWTCGILAKQIGVTAR